LKEATIADTLVLAQQSLQAGDSRKAITILERILAAQPLIENAWFRLGVAALRAKDPSRAGSELRRALVLRPSMAAAWRTLALVDFDPKGSSHTLLRRALLIDPTNLVALLNQGLLKAKRGDRKGEAAAYRIGFLAHPHNPVLAARTARAFYASEPTSKAIIPLSVARILGALSPLDVLNLADCYNRTNALSEAHQVVASVLRASPTLAEAWSEQMEAYGRAGRVNAARRAGQRAQICQPSDGQVANRFARLLMSMWNQPDLLAASRRALVLDPFSSFPRTALRHHGIRACRNSFVNLELAGNDEREATLNGWTQRGGSSALLHMASRFKAGRFNRAPFGHSYVDGLIPADIYSGLIGTIADFDSVTWGINNYSERANVAAWDDIAEILTSDAFRELLIDALGARALADRIRENGFVLSSKFRLTSTPSLDRKHYALGPHRDHVSRFIVCLIYFASPGDPVELGTSIYRPRTPITFDDHALHHFFDRFERLETFAYKPNASLCFVNHGLAYHGVEPILGTTKRHVLQYTVYIGPSDKIDDPFA